MKSQKGALSPVWKGDKCSKSAAHKRAQALIPGPLTCSRPGCEKEGERHHKDGDPWNNVLENLEVLCVEHHCEVDQRHQRPEYKAAVSAANTGRVQTEEEKLARSVANLGREFTAEHRQRIANSKLGKKTGPLKPAHRAKLSAVALGRKDPPQTRANKSAAAKRRWAEKRKI